MNSQNKTIADGYFIYGFTSYGINIGLIASSENILMKMKNVVESLPLKHKEINSDLVGNKFQILEEDNELKFIIDGEFIDKSSNETHILKFLGKRLRLLVAEFAVSKVFIHAGAVSYKNKGIIFPANTYEGKSTLTTELLKAGCLYYSDDFAVLDENAMLHPFPKKISLRGTDGKYDQIDFPVEHFNGQIATEPVEIKFILFTEFEKDFIWKPIHLTQGMGMLEIIPHTIPINFNTKFSLKVLQKLVYRAIITKSKRGEAKDLVSKLLKCIDLNHF